jgi:hypothetical protein
VDNFISPNIIKKLDEVHFDSNLSSGLIWVRLGVVSSKKKHIKQSFRLF